MKAVIEGRMYDTDKAEAVATMDNGHMPNDFHYVEENLYVTRKGNWFVHYVGGALSGYGESFGNERHGSSGIKALTEDEAFEWLQRHGQTDAIMERFASRIEEA